MILLEFLIKKYRKDIQFTSVLDVSFHELNFLDENEPIIDEKGFKVSKSYCYKGKEVVKLEYHKIIQDYMFESNLYNDVYIGNYKVIKYATTDGSFVLKTKRPYLFDLKPVYATDGSETITSFSSIKQRQILKSERYKADEFLQSENPELYAFLYSYFNREYDFYLKTGVKDSLVNALDSENRTEVLAVLNKQVEGFENLSVVNLIKMNLQ